MNAITTTDYTALDLPSLAFAIVSENACAIRTAKTAVDHAIRCGEMLIAAKAKVPHGEWESWLEENAEVSLRTSQRYMRLASNTTSVSLLDGDMGIAEALEMISTPTAPKTDPVAKPKTEKPAVVVVEAEIVKPLTPKEATRLVELEAVIENATKKAEELQEGEDPVEAAIGRLVFILLSHRVSATYIHGLADSFLIIDAADQADKEVKP